MRLSTRSADKMGMRPWLYMGVVGSAAASLPRPKSGPSSSSRSTASAAAGALSGSTSAAAGSSGRVDAGNGIPVPADAASGGAGVSSGALTGSGGSDGATGFGTTSASGRTLWALSFAASAPGGARWRMMCLAYKSVRMYAAQQALKVAITRLLPGLTSGTGGGSTATISSSTTGSTQPSTQMPANSVAGTSWARQ